MASDQIAVFEQSIQSHDATAVRTTANDFEQTISSAIAPPAVGAKLPFEELSLPSNVTTNPSPEQIHEARTGVTPAGLGIAEYGTVAIQSRMAGDEPISLYPEQHIAVVQASDIVPDIGDAVEWFETEIEAGNSSAVFATGPSSTGDMGALVRGVHGPKTVHVVVVTDK